MTRPALVADSVLSRAFASTDTNRGVYVVDGYGLRVNVERGHLVVVDGLGRHRRERRFSRVERDLRRLVVLGHSGSISLEAMRWCADVGVSFVQIDTDGRVLASSAPPRLNDARLRRLQAAPSAAVALEITKGLLDTKLRGQARVAKDLLGDPATGTVIASMADELGAVEDLDRAREVEAQGAYAYFAAWSGRVEMSFASKDVGRVPEHWHGFSSRGSPLRAGMGANRAAEPVNALLNYLYALAEAECRLACLVLGLDPGLGFLHVDTPNRDSLALDLLEPVRPEVDAWVLDLLEAHVFRKADFTETRDGQCRILPPLTHHLAGTMSLWRDAVGPYAESVMRQLAQGSDRPITSPTPLTSARRRASSWEASAPRRKPTKRARARTPSKVKLTKACQGCGAPLGHYQRRWCPDCWPGERRDAGQRGSALARDALVDSEVRRARGRAVSAGKAAAIARAAVEAGWSTDDWDHIRLGLAHVPLAQITTATGLSIATASSIRTGRRRPHPKYWTALAALARLNRQSGGVCNPPGDPQGDPTVLRKSNSA